MDVAGTADTLRVVVMSLGERVVHIVDMTTRPGEAWMLQVGRNLFDEESDTLASKRYLITDRDAKYTQQFRRLVEEGGTDADARRTADRRERAMTIWIVARRGR